MRPHIVALPATAGSALLVESLRVDPAKGPQRLFPIVDESQRVIGVVTRVDLQKLVDDGASTAAEKFPTIIRSTPTFAYPDEPLRVVVHRMAHTGLTRFPVVARSDGHELLGLIALEDLLRARYLNLDAERRRERVLSLPFGFGRKPAVVDGADEDDDGE
jgi:chloride channel protein, CIC family